MIRAAQTFAANGLGTAILVGREDRIEASAKAAGIELNEGIEIINARLSTRNKAYSSICISDCSGRASCSATASAWSTRTATSSPAACWRCATRTPWSPGVTRNSSGRARGRAPRHRHAAGPPPAGVSIVLARGRTVVVADTMITEMPTADELADIAVGAANTARRLGYEPRVAFLAFSTFGHPAGERSQKVIEAVKILESRGSISSSTARWAPT